MGKNDYALSYLLRHTTRQLQEKPAHVYMRAMFLLFETELRSTHRDDR